MRNKRGYTGKRRRWRWAFWLAIVVWAVLAIWIMTTWIRAVAV
jgi:hypothetical protein